MKVRKNPVDTSVVRFNINACFNTVKKPSDSRFTSSKRLLLIFLGAIMKAELNWAGDKAFSYTTNSGFEGFLDGAAKDGDNAKGPSPMEMILCGLGGCSSYDVVNILKKSRQDVIDCKTELQAERAETVPAVFTKIHLHFTVSGHNLKPVQVERAVKLSAEKYCSASIMLERGGVEISHSHTIIELA
ncbi:MAG: putative redox protein [Reinekea sp.]